MEKVGSKFGTNLMFKLLTLALFMFCIHGSTDKIYLEETEGTGVNNVGKEVEITDPAYKPGKHGKITKYDEKAQMYTVEIYEDNNKTITQQINKKRVKFMEKNNPADAVVVSDLKEHGCREFQDLNKWDSPEVWKEHERKQEKWVQIQTALANAIESNPNKQFGVTDPLVQDFVKNYPRPILHDPDTILRKSETLNVSVKVHLDKLKYIDRKTFLEYLQTAHNKAIVLAQKTNTPIIYILSDQFDKSNNWVLAQALALSENFLNDDVNFSIKTRDQISKMPPSYCADHALFIFDDAMYSGEQFFKAMRDTLSHRPKYIVGIVPMARNITHKIENMKTNLDTSTFDATLISIFESENEKVLVEGQYNFVYGREDVKLFYFDHKIADYASLTSEIATPMQVIKLAPPYKKVDGYLANSAQAYPEKIHK